jgi:hypothetical protein
MQAQAQQTIADAVLRHTYSLIEALKDNYRQYSIRGHQRSVQFMLLWTRKLVKCISQRRGNLLLKVFAMTCD